MMNEKIVQMICITLVVMTFMGSCAYAIREPSPQYVTLRSE